MSDPAPDSSSSSAPATPSSITLDEALSRADVSAIEQEPIPSLEAGAALYNQHGDNFLKSLVYRHRPFMYLHSEEKYLPCSVHYYLQHADLYLGNQRIVIPDGKTLSSQLIGNVEWMNSHKKQQQEQQALTQTVTTEDVAASAPFAAAVPPPPDDGRKTRRHHQFNLRLRPAYRGGLARESLADAPVYSYVREREKDFWEIVYIFHYAYNGPYRILGFIEAGAHDADFGTNKHYNTDILAAQEIGLLSLCMRVWYAEHCCARVLKSTDSDPLHTTLHSVYFASHGYLDGQWAFPASSERHPHFESVVDDPQRPVLYIAKNGHGTYPSVGRWWRIWGFANDLTDKGMEWDTKRVVLLHLPSAVPVSPARTTAAKPITTTPTSATPQGSDKSNEDTESDLQWLWYNGCWEYDGIDSVHQQRWWEQDPETSNTTMRRLFFSFMPPCGGVTPDMWALKPNSTT